MSVTPLRLVVVDDHSLFRRGLISLLADMPEFLVVGEAVNGWEALDVISDHKPDVVLLDLNMPVMDGIETVIALRRQSNEQRIMMLTISQDDDDLLAAIRAGADGYLLKNTEPDELRKAILRISQGQSVLSPEVTAPVLRALARAPQIPKVLLSERELEVMRCLAGGQTTLQIAAKLFISENTVKTHVRHILEKLEASNRTEAVSKAIQMGLIQRSY
ncbi:MAG: response regulator transcription factor [Anaerolineaceae bacterium]|jgi:DNA-binding NarL/FixJ family response regulator